MTRIDTLPLFDAMDVAADLLRTADPNYSPADDQLIFRRLQQPRLPGLDREQFQTLFAEWQDRYATKAAEDRKRGIANIWRLRMSSRRRIRPRRRSDAPAGPCSTIRPIPP